MGIRLYIISIMKDEKKGLISLLVKLVLGFLSLFYGLGIKIVDWGYRSGLRKIVKGPVPVVSVGNITVGGTGKTPFSMYLADYFVSKGLKPGILTRGYGKDESIMMKDQLPGVPVIVGQDRVKSSLKAKNIGLDLVILDDGFQHRRLYRGMNILLIDTITFPGNGILLPGGVLREPIDAVKRADIFVLTKVDAAGKERKKAVEKLLRKYSEDTPVLSVRHNPVFLTDVTREVYSLDGMVNKNILLVSAIADPDYFKFLIEKNKGVVVSENLYSDHHPYSQLDINAINAKCMKYNVDMIITTNKDYVKMRELDISTIEQKLFILNIAVEIEEGKEKLLARLNSFINFQRF